MKDARLGTVVADRYRILEPLSSGAMGAVYRAERVQLGRIVAVKFLHTGLAASPGFIKRFEQEARTMSRLDHPHCVSVIDYGVADAPFIVMDFVTGTTLRHLLDDGPQPPARALAIVRQMLAALAHAHEKGIIHRDVKPANVMLAQATGTGDHVRLLDFGLAKLHDGDQSSSSNIVGTPSYMSPEQAAGQQVDARADLYATAVVLFELLTGEKPFQHEEALQLILMHLSNPPPSLRDLRPDVEFSPELEDLVRRGLAKAPGDRFQTPNEFREACDSVPEAALRAGTSPPYRAATVPPTGRARTSPVVEANAATAILEAPAPGAPAGPAKPVRRRRRSRGLRRILQGLLVAGVIGGAAIAWDQLGRPGTSSKQASRPATGGSGSTAAETLDDKIRRLHDQRRDRPRDARIHLQLGRLYVEKGWRAEALAAYLEAIEVGPKLRSDARLIKDIIDALGEPTTRDNARAILVKKIGAPAIPHLRAAQKSRNASLRREATAVLAEISKR